MNFENPKLEQQKLEEKSPELTREQKRRKWEEKLKEVWAYGETDFPAEEKIVETVAALNLLSVKTIASCEGHVKENKPAPWVILGGSEPREKFRDSFRVFQEVADKHNLPFDAVWHPENNMAKKAAEEAVGLFKKFNPTLEETNDYKNWEKECVEAADRVQTFLNEFYSNRTVDDDVRLVILKFDNEFWLHNGKDFKRYLEKEAAGAIKSTPESVVADKLVARQAEMKAFTEFLKEKYFADQN